MAGGARVRGFAALAHVHDICGDVGEQRSSAARVFAAPGVWRYRVALEWAVNLFFLRHELMRRGETPA
jgi:hypothetical protein